MCRKHMTWIVTDCLHQRELIPSCTMQSQVSAAFKFIIKFITEMAVTAKFAARTVTMTRWYVDTQESLFLSQIQSDGLPMSAYEAEFPLNLPFWPDTFPLNSMSSKSFHKHRKRPLCPALLDIFSYCVCTDCCLQHSIEVPYARSLKTPSKDFLDYVTHSIGIAPAQTFGSDARGYC